MPAPRLTRQTLSKATPINLLRLAKFIEIPTKDDCICDKCNHQLIEAVVKKLDAEDIQNSWPPRILERKW